MPPEPMNATLMATFGLLGVGDKGKPGCGPGQRPASLARRGRGVKAAGYTILQSGYTGVTRSYLLGARLHKTILAGALMPRERGAIERNN